MALNTYVDCSSHNGLPNLDAYWNAGHRELMLKATEGATYYWQEMQSIARQWHVKGGTCGYYHWLHSVDPKRQHDWFWSKVSPVWQPGDWLMTDFEDPGPASDSTWAQALKQFNTLASGHGPLHTYTGNWYIANKPLCAAYLRTQQVVMSDYSHSPPLNPYGLTYVAHQFTDKQTVAGFSGPVDYNRWITQPVIGGDEVTPADITAIADAVYTKLLKTDGVLRAPADAADVATNPTWAWQSHIESSSNASRGAWRETVAAKAVTAGIKADTAVIRTQLAGVAKSVASGDAAVIADIGTRVAELQAAVAALSSAPAGAVDATAVVDELASRLNA